ncbi:putative F-box domain-containing protein [Medicago truncatula]|nr:putative F-box domain-containing protein [Medicago truncatula]
MVRQFCFPSATPPNFIPTRKRERVMFGLPSLSDDLIAEVFSFLPVKSLVRFKCVNKYWKTRISDNTFVKLHLNRSATRNPLFTLVTSHITNDCTDFDGGYGMDCSVIPYSFNRLIQNSSFTLSVDPYYHLSYQGCSSIVGNCNGLILLAGGDDCQVVNFCLWNPATRVTSQNFGDFCRSPRGHPFPDDLDLYSFTFGCDISTGTYKIVASYYNLDGQHTSRILSIGDNVWRQIQSFPVVPLHFYLGGKAVHDSVYLSGTLNWLAIRNEFDYDIKNLRVEQFVIVSFDLGTETFSQYRLPSDFDEMPPMMPIVSVLGGFLCCSYFYKETDFLIWQMKELGVEDSWTQFLKINLQNLPRNYDYFSDEDSSDDEIKYQFELVPMLLYEDDDTLVLRSSQGSEAILYNWRENRAERTKLTTSSTIINDNGTSNSILWYSAKVYVESLVSIF